jgi:hypothetical protein
MKMDPRVPAGQVPEMTNVVRLVGYENEVELKSVVEHGQGLEHHLELAATHGDAVVHELYLVRVDGGRFEVDVVWGAPENVWAYAGVAKVGFCDASGYGRHGVDLGNEGLAHPAPVWTVHELKPSIIAKLTRRILVSVEENLGALREAEHCRKRVDIIDDDDVGHEVCKVILESTDNRERSAVGVVETSEAKSSSQKSRSPRQGSAIQLEKLDPFNFRITATDRGHAELGVEETDLAADSWIRFKVGK